MKLHELPTTKSCSKCKQEKDADAFVLRKEKLAKGVQYYLSSACKKCRAEKAARDREKSPEKHRAAVARHREANRDAVNARARVLNRAAYAKDPERFRERHREWSRNNIGMKRIFSAYCRAVDIRALPKWANKHVMAQMYEDARRLSKETGIKFHVDHIVPLQHEIVCGLHWEGNLRIVTASENLRKGNELVEDMTWAASERRRSAV